MWNIASASKNQAFLQQTCVFNSGEEISSSDVNCLLLGHVVWNSTGKLLAASMDNLINIWQLAGMPSAMSAAGVLSINQFLLCLCDNNKYECTTDQELAYAAAYAHMQKMIPVYLPGGDTFLHEMTSWPPS